MVGESDWNVFLIQIDGSSFVEFDISEFEISRVDCMNKHEYIQIDSMSAVIYMYVFFPLGVCKKQMHFSEFFFE